MMKYPLQLSFKILALAPQVYVQDADGQEVCYVKQKLFKLREAVEVFTNSSRQSLLATIQADRVLDFNANYTFRTPEGTPIGSVRRRGMRSIWSAHYEILDGHGQVAYDIREENPWTKIVDSVLGDIPVVGFFSGMFFNPRYTISRQGVPAMRFTKRRAFLEGRFDIEKLGEVPVQDELPIILSLLMFGLLERSRG
ncbi:hypothetical protein [Roseimicrobium sp. ORNL1]|uniref:hypothetical protein n=1 Tax=Roseimicrobium sp. ORNL1 TaxID=2711231 RepID=UPI0013E11FA2|nr:hypothetical protein [Roseimicrobium sp. ORNL1]QIF00940.1 hypothetical protein G5S37_05210 [Roseimicrobium sp. ORNL1]